MSKPYNPIEKQIEILQSRGLVINDINFAEKILSTAAADELQAIKEFEASFEKNPVLIDADESYKKARQALNAEYTAKLTRSYEQAISGNAVDHDLIEGD